MKMLLRMMAFLIGWLAAWPGPAAEPLRLCSFNIKWLGQSAAKENQMLAELLKTNDLVAVQELVAPPVAGAYPDGKPYPADAEASAFFLAMQREHFAWWLSEEDTGPKKNHTPSTQSEWFVVFYRTNKVTPALDLPHGFLSPKRAKNADWDRVPYAFSFRTADAGCDFVLISVHLHPTSGNLNMAKARRKHELAAVAGWIGRQAPPEKDYWIVGDMNFEDLYEFRAIRPPAFVSLNDECDPTTNGKVKKPYDHVLFRAYYSPEIDRAFGMRVVDLRQFLAAHHPAVPVQTKDFSFRFSDHNPVVFQIKSNHDDD